MAKIFKAVYEIEGWKQHTCSACGTGFRYRLKCKCQGQGPTAEAAEHSAERITLRAILATISARPCPECGRYQPDMIGRARFIYHAWVFGLAVLFFFALLVMGSEGWVRGTTLLFWLSGSCLAILLASLAIALVNRNRNLEANKVRAARLVSDGDLQDLGRTEADEDTRLIDDGWGPGLWVVAGCMFFVTLFIFGAALVRDGSGWPINEGWRPEIAGPGDSSLVYFPAQIGALRGYWHATGTGIILNARDLGLADDHVAVTSSERSWGQSISVKSSEKNNQPTWLWAYVHVPDWPGLAGKKLNVEITLNVTYPVLTAQPLQFQEKTEAYRHTAELQLAPPLAGLLYRSLWWTSLTGGATVFLLSGGYLLLRDRALWRAPRPARTLDLDGREIEPPAKPVRAKPKARAKR